MTDDTDDIPPTDPTPTIPQEAKRKPGRPKGSRNATPSGPIGLLDGASLVPNLEANREAVEEAHWYWLGALPACPTEHLDLKGIHFPKVEELVSVKRDGGTQRIPVIGALVQLTIDQVLMLKDRLSRTVIRFRDKAGGETGVGVPVSSVESIQRRKGDPVTIPTVDEVKKAEAAGRATNRYQQRPGDEPAARYLFAQLCENQERPGRGEFYPEPLEITGLAWPGTMTTN